MSEQDPPRLAHADAGAPLLLREALADARADLPSDAALASAWAKITTAIGGGPDGGGDGGGSAVDGGGAAAATKVAAAVAAGTSGGKVIAAIFGIALVVGGGSATWVLSRAEEPGTGTGSGPTADSDSDPGSNPDSDSDSDPDSDSDSDQGSSSDSDSDPDQGSEARPHPATPREPVLAPEAMPPDPAAELALLERAQATIASSPARALGITEQHALQYPTGLLTEEREVLAIDALVRLDRRVEAEARAERFRAQHPRSSQTRRVDALLAE